MYYKPGLTQDSYTTTRCTRCDISLEHSIFKGHKVFYSKSKYKTRGKLCIRCAIIKNLTTETEIEDFVNSKIMVLSN